MTFCGNPSKGKLLPGIRGRRRPKGCKPCGNGCTIKKDPRGKGGDLDGRNTLRSYFARWNGICTTKPGWWWKPPGKHRRETIDSAFSLCGMKCDGMPHGKGRHSDGHSRQGAFTCQRQPGKWSRPAAWVQAIRLTYDYFDDTPVFVMAAAYYGQDVKLRQLAKELGISEDSLNKQRDKFVSTCALFAAAGGLLKIDVHADSKLYGKSAGMIIIDET